MSTSAKTFYKNLISQLLETQEEKAKDFIRVEYWEMTIIQGATTLSIKTYSILTLNIRTYSIMGLFTTFSKNDTQHNSFEHQYAVSLC